MRSAREDEVDVVCVAIEEGPRVAGPQPSEVAAEHGSHRPRVQCGERAERGG